MHFRSASYVQNTLQFPLQFRMMFSPACPSAAPRIGHAVFNTTVDAKAPSCLPNIFGRNAVAIVAQTDDPAQTIPVNDIP